MSQLCAICCGGFVCFNCEREIEGLRHDADVLAEIRKMAAGDRTHAMSIGWALAEAEHRVGGRTK